MFQEIFGNFSSGAIGRGRFIALTLFVGFGALAIVMAVALATGLFDGTGGAGASLLFLLVLLVVGFGALVGQCNLVAKRTRDIGWEPLVTVILYLFFSLIVWIILAIVPGKEA